MQMLREWRGGLHLVATTAVGLPPLEAILTNEGEGQAQFFGWSGPFPDVAVIKAKHDGAEAITDRLCATTLAQALPAKKLPAFEAAVTSSRAAPLIRSGQAGPRRPASRTGYSEGPLDGRKSSPASTAVIAVKDLWCSSECTPPCQGGGRGFKSRQVRRQVPFALRDSNLGPGRVAQLVERAPEKREVRGSMPRPTTDALSRATSTLIFGVRRKRPLSREA